MAAGRAASESGGGRSTRGWTRSFGLLNPLRAVWWLFVNVRFAIVLLVVLTLVSLAGVLIAQVPANVRGDVVLEADWLAEKEGMYGFLTDPMNAVGLFDIFHTAWFGALLAITVLSTGAYVVSRFPGIWAAITRPRRRVPDRYFDLAPHRLHIEGVVDVDRHRRRKLYRRRPLRHLAAAATLGQLVAEPRVGAQHLDGVPKAHPPRHASPSRSPTRPPGTHPGSATGFSSAR